MTILSVDENATIDFSLYPNPTTGLLYINSEQTEIEAITIYTLNGKKVLRGQLVHSTIDVSAIAAGMYFIEITSESGPTIQKFIKN